MITNRTQADADSINIDSSTMSKGAYNYTDLNRVEAKVAELNTLLKDANYLDETLVTKTDWSFSDKFNQSDGKRYLSNIAKIRGALQAVTPSTPPTPTTMNRMNYETANNIEKILVDVEQLIYSIFGWYVYSGVANSGQSRLYQNRFRHFEKLKYDFSSSIIPTDWSNVSTDVYTSVDELGEWQISADSHYRTQTPNLAFDNNSSTRFVVQAPELEATYLNVLCPVKINPTSIFLEHASLPSGSTIEGLNVSTLQWETIQEITSSETTAQDLYTITTSRYYNAFRIKISAVMGLRVYASIYEFQIRTGKYYF